MIITLTPNPSLDRTVTLDGELVRGGVNRLATVTVEPGGKGLNVARVLVSSGEPVTTVLPADEHDPLLRVLEAVSSPELTTVAVPVRGAARINTAVTEPDGTTTKLNEPGAGLSDSEVCAVEEALVAAAGTADGARGRGDARQQEPPAARSWAVLSGSLPPGAPTDWYVQLVRRLRRARLMWGNHSCTWLSWAMMASSFCSSTASMSSTTSGRNGLGSVNGSQVCRMTGRRAGTATSATMPGTMRR